MIQLSAIQLSGTENTRKTADFAVLEGDFGQLLADRALDAPLPGGKILPEGGKTMPDGLPTVEVPSLAGSELLAQFAMKSVKAAGGETALSDTDHDTAAEDDPVAAAVPFMALPVAAPADAKVEFEQDILSAPKSQPALRPAQSDVVPEPVRNRAALEAVAVHEGTAQPTAAAKLAVTALDPSVTDKGQRPADAPQPARIAPGSRGEPAQEIKLQLSADAQPDAGTGGSAERRTATGVAAAQHPVSLHSAQSASPEAPVLPTDALTIREATSPAQLSQPQAGRPQDLTALVDRLVEARENARSNNASLTVMHADFGRVSMHFAHDNGNLTVSLANNDPGFARAVNAAVASDGGMNNDTQADRRGDGGQNAAARASTGEPGLAGERGGQPRGERHQHGGIAANSSHRETAEAHPGPRGVFA